MHSEGEAEAREVLGVMGCGRPHLGCQRFQDPGSLPVLQMGKLMLKGQSLTICSFFCTEPCPRSRSPGPRKRAGKVRERKWGDGISPVCTSPQSFTTSLPPPKFPKLGGNPCLDALESRSVEEVKGMVYPPTFLPERGNKAFTRMRGLYWGHPRGSIFGEGGCGERSLEGFQAAEVGRTSGKVQSCREAPL